MTLFAGTADAQVPSGYEAEDPYAGERLCFRPVPPDRLDYPDREEFYVEKEKYFRQSSIYIDCIDQWVEDARRTYMEMFRQEAQSYLDERKDVMEELRIFGQEQRGH
ncbi:hypothetical protein [Paracoccus sp. T5]|uniref:hypothetical protein n=1 Tax=Paracoccus sp. T5 TaxID=3402161 RepID=UPI003ADE4D82